MLTFRAGYATYMLHGNMFNFLDILTGIGLFSVCTTQKKDITILAGMVAILINSIYSVDSNNFYFIMYVIVSLMVLCVYMYAKQYFESALLFFISIEIYTSYFLHWWWQFLLILLMFLIAYKVAITYYNNNKLEGLLSPMLFALYSTAVVSCYKYKIVVENSWINFPFIFILAIIFPRYKIKNWLKTSFKKGFAVSTKR